MKMLEEQSKKLGRRALLAAGAAGVAAAAAQAIAAPAKVLAANGDPVTVGGSFTGTSPTQIACTADHGLIGLSTSRDGLRGGSGGANMSGVYGYNTNASGHGLFGRNTANLNVAYLAGPKNAVWGEGHQAGQAAIYGTHAAPMTPGVLGVNTGNGTTGVLGGQAGVGAYAPNNGFALAVAGKATFTRSGVLTIPKNAQYAKVSDVALTSSSFVIATLNQYRSGVWIAAAVPNVAADSITIYLNKKATAATKVSWVVLEQFPWA
jgi:hypothetical protein